MSHKLQELTRQIFGQLVNQPFQLALGPEPLTLDLIECNSLGKGQEEEGWREPFSLIFRGPAEPILEQQIYPLTHATIGKLDIFLVPLGPVKGGMKYEAIFT